MLYTYKTIEAMKLAESVYHERYDKIGCPYIAHPLWVAEQVSQVYSGIQNSQSKKNERENKKEGVNI